MATAEAGVCNRALLRIGSSQLINDLGQNSPTARSCLALYPDARDATLEARWWPFARRRKVLAALTDGERGGWAYAYTLPSDCIAPRYIDGDSDPEDTNDILTGTFDPTGITSGALPVPFETEDDETSGRVLLTDQPSAELVYTARIDQVARFTPTFKDALAFKLAADLAFGVAKKPAVGEAMLKAFEAALSRAAASSSKQAKPRRRPMSVFERNR